MNRFQKTFELEEALLCIGCETVSIKTNRCPCCGEATLFLLSTVIDIPDLRARIEKTKNVTQGKKKQIQERRTWKDANSSKRKRMT